MPNPNTITLRNLRVGDSKTLGIRTTDENGTAKNPSSGWFLGLDPLRSTVVTATSAGTVVSFIAAASGATNLWRNVPARVSSDTWSYDTEVTTYSSGAVSGTWGLRPIPKAVPAGASLELLAYPLLPRSSATLSGNKGSIQVLPSGSNSYTAYDGPRRLVYHPDFGTDDEAVVGVHSVDSTW